MKSVRKAIGKNGSKITSEALFKKTKQKYMVPFDGSCTFIGRSAAICVGAHFELVFKLQKKRHLFSLTYSATLYLNKCHSNEMGHKKPAVGSKMLISNKKNKIKKKSCAI